MIAASAKNTVPRKSARERLFRGQRTVRSGCPPPLEGRGEAVREAGREANVKRSARECVIYGAIHTHSSLRRARRRGERPDYSRARGARRARRRESPVYASYASYTFEASPVYASCEGLRSDALSASRCAVPRASWAKRLVRERRAATRRGCCCTTSARAESSAKPARPSRSSG